MVIARVETRRVKTNLEYGTVRVKNSAVIETGQMGELEKGWMIFLDKN